MKLPFFGNGKVKKAEQEQKQETKRLDGIIEKLANDDDQFHTKADEIMARIKKKGTSVHAQHQRPDTSMDLPAVSG